MLRDLLRDAREVPRRVATQGATLIEEVGRTPERILAQRNEAVRKVRGALYDARETGETSLWQLHVTALEAAEDLLDSTEGVPVLDRVGPPARELLEALEAATTHPPIEDYDTLNVRQVMKRLRDLDRFGLLNVRRYEAAHKARKTIDDAVDRELTRRSRLAHR